MRPCTVSSGASAQQHCNVASAFQVMQHACGSSHPVTWLPEPEIHLSHMLLDAMQGVPCSGITVVKHTSAGQQVFQYDADGKLIAAPDCHKHSKHGPHKYVLSPVKAVPVKAAPALQDENACSRSSSLAVGSLSGAMQQQPEQLVSFSGNAGQSLFKSLSVRILQGALQQDPARPAVSLVGKARQSQQSNYPAIPNWSDSSKETNAVTTDVYISRVEPPRLPTAGPLKAGLAAQKQQQQQQCMQQQQQQHPQPGWEHTPIKQANKPQEQWQQQLQALTQIQQS
eukprot:GHRR01028462.1.p1 GENE.GHRR01028462.1~~GHRR01028462.1.p1  ORF type:complete len:283 (+),score=121.58 GHRR01028462.1:599-1447(+)